MALNMKPTVEAPKTPTPEPKGKVAKNASKPVPKPLVGGGTLSQVLAGIRKLKGNKIAIQGNQMPVVKRLPTGVFEFDFNMGGGFPMGRYSIVYGPESSCKTNLVLLAAKQAQRLPPPCNKVVWVDIEHCFDPVWTQKLGVNVEDLLVVQPGYGEEAVDLIDAFVRAEDVAFVGVDSIAPLIANKEIAQSAEKFDIGTSALLIKRLVNKLMVALAEGQRNDHYPCIVLINQTRFKPGVMFGDPETMPGGEAQKFLSAMRVRLNGKPVVSTETNTQQWKDVHATVKKAKVPVRAATFDFKMAMEAHNGFEIGDTDSFNMVKGHLQGLCLLEKTNQGYAIEYAGGLKTLFPTLTSIEDKYQKDLEFRMRLQQLVITNYTEQMITIEEPVMPVKVEPGVASSVQSIATEELPDLLEGESDGESVSGEGTGND